MAERLTEENFAKKALLDGTLSLIDFYSDSCVPCKRLSPVLAELEERFGQRLFVGKVNVAYEAGLTEKYGVMSAPTLLLFKNGEQKKRFIGLVNKAELEAFIEENL